MNWVMQVYRNDFKSHLNADRTRMITVCGNWSSNLEERRPRDESVCLDLRFMAGLRLDLDRL
ncbi:hypothetical protein VN12_05460 [Pirellula sp. SH-Sr6A]|nr:hypothetical protein VN12_05460 [Pirellula sp. SH-Sr6A]